MVTVTGWGADPTHNHSISTYIYIYIYSFIKIYIKTYKNHLQVAGSSYQKTRFDLLTTVVGKSMTGNGLFRKLRSTFGGDLTKIIIPYDGWKPPRRNCEKEAGHTVDVRNPAPVDRENMSFFIGFHREQVV